MDKPRAPSELVKAAGISPPYASQILSGARNPSRPLAVHIFRQTGWKHPLIEALSEEQIATLETIEPYAPRSEAA